jgi:hypothetical protein
MRQTQANCLIVANNRSFTVDDYAQSHRVLQLLKQLRLVIADAKSSANDARDH